MKRFLAVSLLLTPGLLLFISSASTKMRPSTVASADLSISKVDTPDPVNAGDSLTYTITVTNNGPDAAANASWNDTLPGGTTFASLASPGGWGCVAPDPGDTGTVSCSNPSFAVGSAVFTLTVMVSSGLPPNTILSNTATVTSSTPDGNSGNESATATTTVRSPAILSANKSASGTLTEGSAVVYTIVVNNSGADAQNDNPGNEFIDVLPAGLTLVSADASGGTSVANVGTNTVIWNGMIPPGDSVTVTI